jgi:hypothetical protein
MKAILGLIILAVIIGIWLIKGTVRVGRQVYDATVGASPIASTPVDYSVAFRQSCHALLFDPEPLLSNPDWEGSMAEYRVRYSPQELAFMMASGPFVAKAKKASHIGPMDLRLAVVQAAEWVRQGTVRREVFARIVQMADAELAPSGLGLSE